LALVALLSLVAALAGGILAALISRPLALSSLFGLLAVLGLAARYSILLFHHCRRLEQAGHPFGLELVMRGARERVGPMLMTTLAIALGVLPFIIFGDSAGHEMVRPIALIILGGLVTSTLVTLLVTPAIYLSLGASREADIELQPASAPA
jgi:Cu/Ag efflux pump CusA